MEHDEMQAQIQRLVGAFKHELKAMRDDGEDPHTRVLVPVAAWLLSGVIALAPDHDPATILQWANDDMTDIIERNLQLLQGKAH